MQDEVIAVTCQDLCEGSLAGGQSAAVLYHHRNNTLECRFQVYHKKVKTWKFQLNLNYAASDRHRRLLLEKFCFSWEINQSFNILGLARNTWLTRRTRSWREWTLGLHPDRWRHNSYYQYYLRCSTQLPTRETLGPANACSIQCEGGKACGGCEGGNATCGTDKTYLRYGRVVQIVYLNLLEKK